MGGTNASKWFLTLVVCLVQSWISAFTKLWQKVQVLEDGLTTTQWVTRDAPWEA